MRVLVTGGTGLRGSHLFPKLVAEPHRKMAVARSASVQWRWLARIVAIQQILASLVSVPELELVGQGCS